MRWLIAVFVFGALAALATGARADDASTAREEMAAALEAQADLHPGPADLPVTAAAPRHAADQSAVKRGITPRGVSEAARAAASQYAQQQAHGASQALAKQAQAAAASAAGQAEAQAAKQRPHPRPR
jgi:phage terminase small subunit